MSLQEQLDALRAQSKTRIPAEAQVVMQRSIDGFAPPASWAASPRLATKLPTSRCRTPAGSQ